MKSSSISKVHINSGGVISISKCSQGSKHFCIDIAQSSTLVTRWFNHNLEWHH